MYIHYPLHEGKIKARYTSTGIQVHINIDLKHFNLSISFISMYVHIYLWSIFYMLFFVREVNEQMQYC